MSRSGDTTVIAVGRQLSAFLIETRGGKLLRWAVALGVAATVFYFSVLSTPPSGTASRSLFDLLPTIAGFGTSQWRHVLAYAGLAYSLAFATCHWQLLRWRRAAFVIVAAATYGLSIEVAQSFTATRVFDTMDILANTLGALLVIPWYAVSKWIGSRLEIPTSDHT